MNDYKAKLQQLVMSALDRKLLLGVTIGASVMVTGYALSDDSLFNIFVPTSSSMISQQKSVVADSISKDAADCANGAPGSIGEAVNDAWTMHTQMAQVSPNIEQLFDVGGSCFGQLGQIWDLSTTIPSLGSIMSAAENAIMKFAQRQVCSAVQSVDNMVSAPINNAFSSIGGLQNAANLNGFTNQMVQKGLNQVSPALGSQYSGAQPGATYTIQPNAFTGAQSSFSQAPAAAQPAPSNSSVALPTSGSSTNSSSNSGGILGSLGNLFN